MSLIALISLTSRHMTMPDIPYIFLIYHWHPDICLSLTSVISLTPMISWHRCLHWTLYMLHPGVSFTYPSYLWYISYFPLTHPWHLWHISDTPLIPLTFKKPRIYSLHIPDITDTSRQLKSRRPLISCTLYKGSLPSGQQVKAVCAVIQDGSAIQTDILHF